MPAFVFHAVLSVRINPPAGNAAFTATSPKCGSASARSCAGAVRGCCSTIPFWRCGIWQRRGSRKRGNKILNMPEGEAPSGIFAVCRGWARPARHLPRKRAPTYSRGRGMPRPYRPARKRVVIQSSAVPPFFHNLFKAAQFKLAITIYFSQTCLVSLTSVLTSGVSGGKLPS